MTNLLLLSYSSAIAIMACFGTSQAIPPECKFTGTSGLCAGMAGRFIRPEYKTSIHVLYIVNSDLTALTSDDFSRFQRLSTLHINNCTLPRMSGRSLLSDLKHLKALQITHSNLSDDIKYMFVNNTELSNLSLQNNKLTQIRKDTFSHLTELDTIDVSNNDISKIDQDAFINLINLKKLDLKQNKFGKYFDTDFLSLSEEQCGTCGGICPINATSRCEGNKETDHLWRAFEENYDIVFLKGNPICSKLEKTPIPGESKTSTDSEGRAEQLNGSCVLLQGNECTRHEDRRKFFSVACTQNAETRRRGSRNHGDDLPPDPEAKDGVEVGGVPESAPDMDEEGDRPAPGNSMEEAGEDGGQRVPVAGGAGEPALGQERPSAPDSNADSARDTSHEDDDRPLSSGEGDDEEHAHRLSQSYPRSALFETVVGVGAAGAVGAALLVFVRTKRSYGSVRQEDEEAGEDVIEIHEIRACSSKEATPLGRMQT